jgi:hypothetical protein
MLTMFATLPYFLYRHHSARDIGILVGIFALYCFFVIAKDRWTEYRTGSWLIAHGTISDVHTENVDGGLNGVDYTKVHFSYGYVVDGKSYGGKFHVNCMSENLCRDTVDGISKGEAVVHYDPSNPSKSVLWQDEVEKLY